MDKIELARKTIVSFRHYHPEETIDHMIPDDQLLVHVIEKIINYTEQQVKQEQCKTCPLDRRNEDQGTPMFLRRQAD